MPTVPVSRQTTVRDQALPGVRVNTNQPLSAFGGGELADAPANVARGMTKEAMDFAIQRQMNADDLRVQDADLEASKAQSDIQVKIKEMVGKDAFAAPDYLDEEWKKRTEVISKGLANDRQRRHFDRIKNVRYNDMYKSTNEHVSVEGKRYDAASTDAYIKNSQSVAAINYTDTSEGGQIEQSLFLQEQAIRKFGDRNGVPEEIINQKISEARSETHVAVLNQMISNDEDLLANEYFKNNKEHINSEARKQIKEVVEKSSLQGEGQRTADEVFLKYKDNRNQAYDYVKEKIKDPELRKQTENELEKLFTRQSISKRETNYKNYQLASQMVEQNQRPPANITSELTAEQQSALNRRLKQVNAGVEPNTDWTEYYNLKNMAAENKNEFIKQNLLEYRHMMADAEFKELSDTQAQLMKNDVNAQKNLNGFRSATQIVNDTLTTAGINIRSRNSKDQKMIAQFKRMVDENLQIIQDQTGKKPKSEDVQKVVDNLLIQDISTKGMFGKGKRVFELQYKDIPEADRVSIHREMRRRGIQATEQNVLDIYTKGVLKRKERNGY